jgi:hypothetical protein
MRKKSEAIVFSRLLAKKIANDKNNVFYTSVDSIEYAGEKRRYERRLTGYELDFSRVLYMTSPRRENNDNRRHADLVSRHTVHAMAPGADMR